MHARMRRAGVAVLLMALAVLPPRTVDATQVGAGQVVGSGTLSPGLTLNVPVDQSYTFTGTATGLMAATAPLGATVVCTITAYLTSIVPETVLAGMGHGSATCSGVNLLDMDLVRAGRTHDGDHTLTVSCLFTYVRVGTVFVIFGGCNGVFIFIPTSTSPTTSYTLVGIATLATAP